MPSLEISLPQNDRLLELISSLSTPAILVVSVVHFVAFFYLIAWSRRDLLRMTADVDAFTRGLKHRSVLDRTNSLSDQIDALLADISDVLEDPARSEDRQQLWSRIKVLDENRRYLQSQSFETWYTVCRTMIEGYPLAGILGTILAIGAALQVPKEADGGMVVTQIVRYFGDAIWSTFAGLVVALVLMFLNSVFETSFRRLSENRQAVRETVARVKRELALSIERTSK